MPEQPKSRPPAAARGNFNLQFVTVPTADTFGTTMVLHFDDQKYLFGQVSEGFQRACIQRGVSLRKIHNVFLTGTTEWQKNGGLLGLILCVADVQITAELDRPDSPRQRFHLHGGPKLLHSLACARRFVFRTGIPLTVYESKTPQFQWRDEPTFSDDNIRVWSIPIFARQPSTQAIEKDSQEPTSATREDAQPLSNIDQDQALRQKVVSDMFESDWQRDRLFERAFKDISMPATVWVRNPDTHYLEGIQCIDHYSAPAIGPDQIVLVRDPWPAALVPDLPTASNLPSRVSMSYIMKGHSQRGVFDPKKAKSLGIKAGPAYADLARGASITLDNGTVITPDMVLGPTREGKGFAFFDLPSRSHLDDFREMITVQPPEMMQGISAVVWMLGPNLSSLDDFKDLTTSIPDMQHIVIDPKFAPNHVTHNSVALSNIRLARFAPAYFPLVHFNHVSSYQYLDRVGTQHPGSPPLAQPYMLTPRPGTKLSVHPNFVVDHSDAQSPFDPSSSKEEDVIRGWQSLETYPTHKFVKNSDLIEPELITLGTGSALPSKYRNVSGTLLRMPGDQGNYLFDCGENTIGQLRRIYASADLMDVLRNLRAIWISHMHADHHLGTLSVLLERARVFDLSPQTDRTIYLISEPSMHKFVQEYSSVEPNLLTDTGLVSITSWPDQRLSLNRQPFDFNSTPSALRNVQSVGVAHCAGAQAVTFTFKSGFKISYSGDCRPSSYFCRIGSDSDVLIHEATFDNGMEGDAMAKKHSTTAEALGVALNMRAKNVVLTHFSQRYHKIPNFDNMRLPGQIRFEEGSAAQEEGPVDDGSSHLIRTDPNSLEPQHEQKGEREQIPPSPHNPRPNSASTAQQQMHIAVAFDYMRFFVSDIPKFKPLYLEIQAMFDAQDLRDEEKKEENKRQMADIEAAKQAKSQARIDKFSELQREESRLRREQKQKQRQNRKRDRNGDGDEDKKDAGLPQIQRNGSPVVQETTAQKNGEMSRRVETNEDGDAETRQNTNNEFSPISTETMQEPTGDEGQSQNHSRESPPSPLTPLLQTATATEPQPQPHPQALSKTARKKLAKQREREKRMLEREEEKQQRKKARLDVDVDVDVHEPQRAA